MASPENDIGAGSDEDWENGADAAAQETINTATDALETNEAPAAEVPLAPPKIAFKHTPCVLVFSHSEGPLVSIGALSVKESPHCIFHVGILNENREVSLWLMARFPTTPFPNGDQYQRIWLYFYGDAFKNVVNDFVITPVNELHEIADPLRQNISVLRLAGIGLHKLQLTYQPEKVVAKGKDDPNAFHLVESSFPAGLFRGLVERGEATTLSLYFRARPKQVEALRALKERLRVGKDVK